MLIYGSITDSDIHTLRRKFDTIIITAEMIQINTFQVGEASMLSESQTSIFTLSNGLSTINTNKDIFNAEDLLTNDQGEVLSEHLMEEILKCVSNSNCL